MQLPAGKFSSRPKIFFQKIQSLGLEIHMLGILGQN